MAEIRTLVRPAKLYRYRSMDGAQRLRQELAAIETGYLWCAGFRQMNDPMEGLYEVDQAFRNDPDFVDFRDRVYHGKLDVGICSLSETGTNELMWAHYADQFKGICIEYDLSRLLDALPGDVDVVRLHYDDTLPRIARDVGAGRGGARAVAKRILSCKHRAWIYEREWRALAQPGQLVYGDPQCVTGVVAGPRMPDTGKRRVEELCGDLGIPVTPMEVDGYRLRA